MIGVALSVVLPFHNQADDLAQIVADHTDALARFPGAVQLVLVPNGSCDDTAPICRRIAAGRDDMKVVELAHGGWGAAVRAGLSAADGALLCYTNSARTEPGQLLLMALYAHAYPNVVIKANRRVRDNLRRRIGSLLYNIECRLLFDLSTWDINGTPKVFPRAFDRLLGAQSDDDLYDAEFVAICSRAGYPIVEIPILATVRRGGTSTTTYGSAYRMYRGALALRRRMR
ncbi:MAG TPA: glycosyltransferase [Solirubrobacteraceae bacterium]